MKRRGKNGFRLTQFLLACGMLAFVTVFVTVAMRGDLERRRVASWPEVACEIVGSEVKQKSLDDYRFTASFKYEANGRTKSSSLQELWMPRQSCRGRLAYASRADGVSRVSLSCGLEGEGHNF